MKATPRMLFEASPRGQQSRGARWEQYTKANYGSNRGNSYRNSGRRRPFFPQISPEAAVYSIIGINGVVFLLWRSGQERMNSFRDSKLLSWMFRNFTTMWANLREGRVWTLITPAFSHIEPLHLFVNMFVLYSFGPDLARLLGVKRFLAFYLGAAACGNLISALLRGVVFPVHTRTYNSATQPSLGASTSVVGITTLFACLYPNATFQIFFFLPVPAWLATAGFIGWDVWRVMRSERTKVDGAGHLGGAAAGLGYYWFRLRPLIRRMR
ncbi:hypothetical protein GGI12_003154 [Dipsacomyces acuminosporus]|nr:hypothetical protein GGI12_003154 [Dipsacomyces acuminosporus]